MCRCARAVQATAEYIVNCVGGYRQVHIGLSFVTARNVRHQEDSFEQG
jgi:hypothetical protein